MCAIWFDTWMAFEVLTFSPHVLIIHILKYWWFHFRTFSSYPAFIRNKHRKSKLLFYIQPTSHYYSEKTYKCIPYSSFSISISPGNKGSASEYSWHVLVKLPLRQALAQHSGSHLHITWSDQWIASRLIIPFDLATKITQWAFWMAKQ